MRTTFDHIDVDKRIDAQFERAQRIIRHDGMTRRERAYELSRIAERCIWWDSRRDLASDLDTIADAATPDPDDVPF